MSAGLALLKRVPYVGTALSAAPWVIAGLALAWGGLQRMHYLDCKAARAADKAAAEEAARATLELDARNVREVQAKAAAEIAVLRQEARDRDARIASASAGACPNDGPFGALYDSVRARQRTRGGEAAGSAGR